MNMQALEAEILKDLNAAPAALAKLKDFLIKLKGSPFEPFAEKLWPGISTVEDKVLEDIDFFLSLDAQLVAWLSLLFPKVPA